MKPQILEKILSLGMIGLLMMTMVIPAFAQNMSTQITIRVDGLSCPFCAYGLEKKLKRLEGTVKVQIDLDRGVAVITVAEGENIEENRLRKAVEDSGFTPRKITYQSLNQ